MHEHDHNLIEEIQENFSFILVALLITVIIAIIAKLLESMIAKKLGKPDICRWNAKRIAFTALFAAVGGVLMLIEIPMTFIVPSFYTLDLSEIAGVMAGCLLGPVSGVMVEFIKALIHVLIHGTHSAFVGEFAAFVTGSLFVIPTAVLYMLHRTKKGAVTGLIFGALTFVIGGAVFNALYLIPKFANMYGMRIEDIVSMGTAINPAIQSLWTFVAMATVPFNLIKAAVVFAVVMVIYKPLSNIYRKI